MKSKVFIRFIFFIFLFVFSFKSYGQLDSKFWFAGPDISAVHGDSPIKIVVTAFDFPAEITITQPANQNFTPIKFTVQKQTSFSYDLTSIKGQIETSGVNNIKNTGLLITSTSLVTAYYLVDRQNNADIFSLKGSNALGTEFLILSQKDLGSAMADGFNAAYILATENNTKITITPSVDLVGYNRNIPFVITLSKGQVYVAAAANSAQIGNQIGGTFVSSDKPISIVLSDDSAKFQSAGCYDLNGDQLIPVCLAGKEYVTMPGSLNVNVGGLSNVTDIVYVYATEDDTQLTVNGQVLSQKRNRGGYFPIYNRGQNNYITSNKPVLIYQLGGNGCEVGGAVIPQMTRGGLDFSSAMRLTDENFIINILTKEEFKDDFEIVGISGNYSIFWTTLNNNWVSGRIDLSNLSLVGVGKTIYFKNSAGNFHLGWINGGLGSGTRYGYFSNFSIALNESEVISSTSDQEAIFSISNP